MSRMKQLEEENARTGGGGTMSDWNICINVGPGWRIAWRGKVVLRFAELADAKRALLILRQSGAVWAGEKEVV